MSPSPPRLHLKKLSVGPPSADVLIAWQERRLAETGLLMHVTRAMPRRAAEILPGGSIFWIIKGVMRVRQRIAEFREVRREDGSRACGIVLVPGVVPVRPRPHRAFQGWRYLEAAEAPPDSDIATAGDDAESMPPEMAEELQKYGLL